MSPTLLLLLVAAFSDSAVPGRELREARSAPQGVLLDFTATWCGPCQQMSPIISRLERQGYPIRKVDIDQEKQLATQFGISSIPCFVLVVNGREVNRITGQTSEAQLRRLLTQIPTTPPADVAGDPPKTRPVSNEPADAGGGTDARPAILREEIAANDPPPAKKKGFGLPLFGNRRDKDARPETPPDIRGNNNDAEGSGVAAGEDPLAASTRLRVRDEKGINFGTGTIIDSKPGRTVILTCGHIFRDMKDDSTIEVDVFEGKKVRKYVGKLIAVDKEGDVGLVSVPTDSVLTTAKIAPVDAAVKVDDAFYSIGCSSGETPTKIAARVTALNRYYGPDNVECTGLPVPGRSGGGLFNDGGELVGVCFAADQKEKRGLYAGLKPIHALMVKAGKSATAPASPFDESSATAGAPTGRAANPRRNAESAPAEEPVVEFGGGEPAAESRALSSAPAGGSTARGLAEAAAAAASAGDAEVICIIRPLNQPQAASKVVIINKASHKFMNYLQGELRTQPKPTSGRIEFSESARADGIQRYTRSPESRR